ncbi:MAG: CRISPR-associated ring nuclease, partial [Promethearchaeota archaeon]
MKSYICSHVQELHVIISGGRKTMSRIFTSLANIFPINMVYQLITTYEIEQKGYVNNFLTEGGILDEERLRLEEHQRIFHPKRYELPSSLIEIPILHTIEVEELLDIAEKIDKGEP